MVNIVTGLAYLGIPYEIWKWRKALSSRAANYLSILFVAFITFCGLHHFVDVIIMPTAPWWAILSVNLPMALVSAVTLFYLQRNRELLIKLLEEIGELLASIQLR